MGPIYIHTGGIKAPEVGSPFLGGRSIGMLAKLRWFPNRWIRPLMESETM
jgi:hypothetical protein